MIKRSRFPRLFFGWWIVIASGVIAFMGNGLSFFGFSALFKPIALELGFSRAATSVAPSLSRLVMGVLSSVVGWITDKFGPRWIVFSGALVVGVSLIVMNFVNSLWAFYLVWGILLGIGTSMGGEVALDKTITNWFVKKRGRALSIRWGIFNLSAVLSLPLIGWLVSIQGWRMACVIAGVIMWIIGMPLAWFFMKRHRPEYYGFLPDGAITQETLETSQMIDRGIEYAAESEEVEFTLRQTIRTPAYWLLIMANMAYRLVHPIFIIHSVPFLTDMGVEPVKAAVMIGIMSSGSIPGAFIGGFVADRVKKQYLRFVLAGAFLLEMAGYTAFILNPTLIMVYPLFILLHFAGGIYSPLNSIIGARYFGRKAFGSIRGTLMMLMLPATMAAPIYAGWLFDTTGNYMIVFTTCVVLLIIAIIFASLVSPPKPPDRITDIHEIV